MRAVATPILLLIAAALSVVPALAGEPGWLPKPARGEGDKCVADTDWMRRNHMSVLMHQRDGTVHDGVRARRFSLKGCIECHAVKGGDGGPVPAADGRHFCRTCHDYAAVRIDCFECHASRPAAKAATTGGAMDRSADAARLSRYLRERER